MRTYLTRLSMTAAGVALSAVSLTGVANANDGDGNAFVDPSVLEELGNLEPCDEVTASEDMVMVPVDPNEPHTPLPPGEIELIPCYQLPTDPEDGDGDGNGDDGDGNGDDEPADDGDNDGANDDGNSGGANGNSGDQGGQGDGGSNGQSSGTSSSGSGPSDGAGEGAGDTASDETSQPQETVTPTAATGNGDHGALVLAMLAGLLGAVGLFLFVYGLRKRPRRGQQPA